MDKSIEKYGVRSVGDKKAYGKVYGKIYYKAHHEKIKAYAKAYMKAKAAKKKAQGLHYRKGPTGKWGWYPCIHTQAVGSTI